MVRRQRELRTAADVVTKAWMAFPEIQAIAVIGSAAKPLWKEVPRFREFRKEGIEVWHECRDLDMALWIDSQNRLGELRRVRDRALREAYEAGSARALPTMRLTCFCSSRRVIAISVGCARSTNVPRENRIARFPVAARFRSTSALRILCLAAIFWFWLRRRCSTSVAPACCALLWSCLRWMRIRIEIRLVHATVRPPSSNAPSITSPARPRLRRCPDGWRRCWRSWTAYPIAWTPSIRFKPNDGVNVRKFRRPHSLARRRARACSGWFPRRPGGTSAAAAARRSACARFA